MASKNLYAENRPVRWTQGNKVVTMDFDRMGRRVFYREMDGDVQLTYTKFFYNGYLCIMQLFSDDPPDIYKEFIWDPTEPVATRPLCFREYYQMATFLMHDGNKNVTDVVTVGPNNEVVGHYDYAPFGAITSQAGSRASANPFRFSSEFHDDTLGLVYYNYRHYNPQDGRWCGRDPQDEYLTLLFVYCKNVPTYLYDFLGLECCDPIAVNYKLVITKFSFILSYRIDLTPNFQDVFESVISDLFLDPLEDQLMSYLEPRLLTTIKTAIATLGTPTTTLAVTKMLAVGKLHLSGTTRNGEQRSKVETLNEVKNDSLHFVMDTSDSSPLTAFISELIIRRDEYIKKFQDTLEDDENE